MCHFIPVHYLGIAFFGNVEGQNTTKILVFDYLFAFFNSTNRGKSTSCLYLIIIILCVSHTNVNWGFSAGVSVTARQLDSSWLFLKFWPILTMLYFWSLHSFSYFYVHQLMYQSFGDCTKCTNYSRYHRHFHVPQFFNSLARLKYVSFISLSFIFNLSSAGKFSFLLLTVIRSSRLSDIIWFASISKFQRGFYVSFSRMYYYIPCVRF